MSRDNLALGVYVPGTSVLHRVSVGAKLFALAGATTAMMWWGSPVVVTVAAGVTFALVALAQVGWGTWLNQVRPVVWMTLLVAALQWWSKGPAAAYVAAGGLLVSVGLAALLTLTTRTEAMMNTVITALRPLRRFGVNPDRIALLLTLTLRTIPVLARVVTEADQARIARGAPRSVRALVVPATVRTVRYADHLGEALIARGFDD